jgi:hypothetical protein
MDVEIQDVITEIRAVDSESLLTPEILEALVEAVTQAIEQQELHRARIRAEQHISGGVSHELEDVY